MRSEKALINELKRAVIGGFVTPAGIAYKLGYKSSNIVYKWIDSGHIPSKNIALLKEILNGEHATKSS